jgi:hypothetical protein
MAMTASVKSEELEGNPQGYDPSTIPPLPGTRRRVPPWPATDHVALTKGP